MAELVYKIWQMDGEWHFKAGKRYYALTPAQVPMLMRNIFDRGQSTIYARMDIQEIPEKEGIQGGRVKGTRLLISSFQLVKDESGALLWT